MKPLSLFVKAFGPYTNILNINFESLENNNIFLISGPTGAGKTAILDAISFALYCRSTGGLRSFRDMRSATASNGEDTVLEFEFYLKNKKYKFIRKLRSHKVRGQDRFELRDEHECYEFKEDSYCLIHSGSEAKIRAYAEEIIGLDSEEFSKVIILPQGEFKKLLLANSREKYKIFERLFKTDKWSHITEYIQNKTNALKKGSDNLMLKREVMLQKEQVETIEHLIEKIKNLEIKKSQQDNLYSELQKQHKLNLDLLDLSKKINLIENEKKAQTEDLSNLKNKYKSIESDFNLSKLNLNIISDIENEIKEQITNKTKIEKNLDNAEKIDNINMKIENTEKIISQKTKEKIELENLAKQAIENQNKGETYINNLRNLASQIPSLFEQLKKCEHIDENYNLLSKIKTNILNLKNDYNKYKNSNDAEKMKLALLKERLNILQKQLNLNISASLASQLKENAPCPVCGSKDHPNPANQNLDFNSVSIEKEIAILEKSILEQEKNLNENERSLFILESKLNEAQSSLNQQNTVCESFNTNVQDNLIKLETIKSNYDKAKKAESLISAAQTRLNERKNEYDIATIKLNLCSEEIINLNANLKSYKLTKDSIVCFVDKENFDIDSLKRSMVKSIQRIKVCEIKIKEIQDNFLNSQKEIESIKTLIKTKNESAEELSLKLKELKLKINSLNSSKAETLDYELKVRDTNEKLNLLIEETGKLKQSLKSSQESLEGLILVNKEFEKNNHEYSHMGRLANFLSGNNKMKIPIKMFVLTMMLDQILMHSNVYLSIFSKSRYALSRFYPEGVSRGYGGLDIEVFDSHYGRTRPIDTLSGGELFLASLSLAFGLSDVIQNSAGGIRLDSLFIDEGFGSLDSETLDLAMQALDEINKTGRLVGIISHISELKNRIQSKIEVFKNSDGSSSIKML